MSMNTIIPGPQGGDSGSEYVHAQAGYDAERERLRLLEHASDPATIRRLEQVGVGEGWSCLEVAAGAGSIAAWLGHRVGPDGRVLASDMDTRFLGFLGAPVEVKVVDLLADDLEEGAFDLVHGRAILMHLQDPEAALKKMAAAVKPGGWLLLEEKDYEGLAGLGDHPEAGTFSEDWRSITSRFKVAGTPDTNFGRRIRDLLERLRFEDIVADGDTRIWRGGETGAQFVEQSYSQFRDRGMATDEEYRRAARLLRDPSFTFRDGILYGAWGRRPNSRAASLTSSPEERRSSASLSPTSPVRVAVPEKQMAEDLTAHAGDFAIETSIWSIGDPPPAEPFDILLLEYKAPGPELRQLPAGATRVVQSPALGYDGVATNLGRGFVFCNAAGVHEATTAELAVGLMIADRRGFPTFFDAQQRGEWAHGLQPGLAGSRVLLVGTGGVGEALRRRLEAFEVDLVRVGRRARADTHGPVHGADELGDLLPTADIVVLAVPLDDSTRGMVSEDFLARMRNGSLLVNVARGPVVDTDALVEHVREGRIHAALDVTDPEPLPPDHALWAAPTVFITPHIGGYSGALRWRLRRLLLRQIDLLAAGRDPVNVVYRT
jgi:phosphoglycerate dehydrogenase-like enzyme/SAM-dependent methyltransferase